MSGHSGWNERFSPYGLGETGRETCQEDDALILVVEDHEGMRDVLAAVLEQRGYMVETVVNGQEALQSLRIHEPDLIVTDLIMPVLDGLQLARAITTENGSRKVPLILVSERLLDFPAGLEMDRFFDAVVLKPVRPTELLERVAELLPRS